MTDVSTTCAVVIFRVVLGRLKYPRGIKNICYTKFRPRPHVSLFAWKRRFFSSALAYRPHVSDENSDPKRIFSKTISWVEIFENAGFSFTCGRKKTEVFEYDDVICNILLPLRMLRKGCYRISIVVSLDVDRLKILAYATCGRRKTSSFSKKSGYVRTKP